MLSQVGVPAGVAYRQPVTEHASRAGATMMRRIKLKIVFKIFFVTFLACIHILKRASTGLVSRLSAMR